MAKWTPLQRAPLSREILVGWRGSYVDVAIFDVEANRWIIRDTVVADHDQPDLMPSHWQPIPAPDDKRWRAMEDAPSRQEILVGWTNQPWFVDIAFSFYSPGNVVEPYESTNRQWRYRNYQNASKNGDHADQWMALPAIKETTHASN